VRIRGHARARRTWPRGRRARGSSGAALWHCVRFYNVRLGHPHPGGRASAAPAAVLNQGRRPAIKTQTRDLTKAPIPPHPPLSVADSTPGSRLSTRPADCPPPSDPVPDSLGMPLADVLAHAVATAYRRESRCLDYADVAPDEGKRPAFQAPNRDNKQTLALVTDILTISIPSHPSQ
jgi:hypothetical protein